MVLGTMHPDGKISMVPATFNGSWESFTFIEVEPVNRLVHIRKRNAPDFAIDGNAGGEKGQNVNLGDADPDDIDQQWLEIYRGNGYYTYQKVGTNFVLDGNNGGENGQNVHLWEEDEDNHNQHWEKVSVALGAFQLIKRNAPGFAINGGNNGADGQNINLFDSSVESQNLHWLITPIDTDVILSTKEEESLSSISIFPNPAIDQITINGANGGNYELFDNSGQLYQSNTIKSENEVINVNQLSQGIYFIRVVDGENTTIEKVIIK